MSDKGITTPRSAQESHNTPKYPAVKDKNCPFCQQAFTSSSLGRHLDLYIKPKNPKPADGIHNVDEIRRIRGNITRRHPRSSTSKKDDSSAGPKDDQLNDDDGSPIAESPPPLNIFDAGKVRQKYSDANWSTNGVVSNVPQRPTLNVPDRGRSVSRHIQQKTEFEQRRKASEEWINAKAAELALKEVLSSVKDASARSTGMGLFDFDPFTLNFPSLCLHVLPPPPTLFSPTPFPTSESWSINPPGPKQFEALLRHVKERITFVNRQRQHFQLPNGLVPPSYNPTTPTPLPTPPLLEVDGSKVLSHVQEAFQHWKTLPEKQRQEAWQLEILRCYVRRGESRRDLENKMEAAERELAQLKASPWLQYGMDPVQYAQLVLKGSSQSPQISTDTVRELAKQGINVRGWDYDRLIEKWRGVVREQRKPSSGMSSQRSLSACSSQHTPTRPYTGGSGMLNTSLHQVVGVNGTSADTATSSTAMSQPTSASTVFSVVPTSDSTMDDDVGDQADGEGEDEDAEAEDEVDTAPQEYKMSTPAQHTQHTQHQPHPQQQTPQQIRRQQQQHHHQVVQAWAQHNMSHHQHSQAMAQSQHQHIAQHLNGRAQQMLVDAPVMMTMDGMEAGDDNFLDRGMALGMGGLTESYAQLAGTGGG